MGEIYGNAEECAIWLGDVDDATVAGISRLIGFRHFYSFFRDKYSDRTRPVPSWILKRSFWITVWDMSCLCIFFMGQALGRTHTAWINRAWIRQEYHLSKKHSFYFGPCQVDHSLARFDLLGAWLIVVPTVRGGGGFIYPGMYWCAKVNDLVSRVGSMDYRGNDLLSMVSMELRLGVSDPRDRIYSLLSMVTSSERVLIKPEYNISCAETFTRATSAAIAGCAYGLMAFFFVSFDALGVHWQGLPTWAIDLDDTQIDQYTFYRNTRTRWVFPIARSRVSH
jgi:hypothetical protein